MTWHSVLRDRGHKWSETAIVQQPAKPLLSKTELYWLGLPAAVLGTTAAMPSAQGAAGTRVGAGFPCVWQILSLGLRHAHRKFAAGAAIAFWAYLALLQLAPARAREGLLSCSISSTHSRLAILGRTLLCAGLNSYKIASSR